MRRTRKVLLLALSLSAIPGCGEEASVEPPLVVDQPRLAMKCSFSSKSFTHAMPREAFAYLVYDSGNAPFVVHGIARAQEDLTSEEMGLQGDLPFHAAMRTATGFEWKERDAARRETTNWLGSANSTGELFIGFGVSHLSEIAYPGCFAREL